MSDDAPAVRIVAVRWEGQEYPYDGRLMLAEAMAVKTATGMGVLQFEDGVRELDPFAVAAIVWIARRRAGERDLAYTDVDGDLSTFDFVTEPIPKEPADPATTETTSPPASGDES